MVCTSATMWPLATFSGTHPCFVQGRSPTLGGAVLRGTKNTTMMRTSGPPMDAMLLRPRWVLVRFKASR